MSYTQQLTHWKNEAQYQLGELRKLNGNNIKNVAVFKRLVSADEVLFSLRVDTPCKVDEYVYQNRYEQWQCVVIYS